MTVDAQEQARLAGAAQRVRLLVSGVAGPLSEKQRILSTDVLKDLEALLDSCDGRVRDPKPERFQPLGLVQQAAQSYLFKSRSRQLQVNITGDASLWAVADPTVAQQVISDAFDAVIAQADVGSMVHVEIASGGDNVSVFFTGKPFDPRLPPAPPSGSNVGASILRAASGTYLVIALRRSAA